VRGVAGRHAPPAADVNETQFQRQVTDLLDLYGWLWYHTHDSRRSPSGFLDITAVRRERLIFVELKQAGKYPTPEQREWMAKLYVAGQEVAVWWPRDLPTAIRVLGPRQERLVLPERYRQYPIDTGRRRT
jgi:hypothetical protein